MLVVCELKRSVSFEVVGLDDFLPGLLFSDVEVLDSDFEGGLQGVLGEDQGPFEFERLQFKVVFVLDDVLGEIPAHKQQRHSLVVEAHLLKDRHQFADVGVGELWLLEGEATEEVEVLDFVYFLEVLSGQLVVDPLLDGLGEVDYPLGELVVLLVDLGCVFLEFVEGLNGFLEHG